MSSRRALGALSALLAVALGAGPAAAQESRGRVQGLVTDTSGAIVPGASVVLTNDGTQVAVTRVTNRDGRYLFDYVDPASYTIKVELAGFKTTIQQNVRVQQRADVTVDVKLPVGGIEETVTVTEAPVAVQFNTATRDLTVEQQMVKELPSSTRNPFQLALLDPTILNRGSTIETQPFFHRTANEMDIGGDTKYRNDILLDGTPLTAGNKLGYTPPMDAVTEYTVQQNAVDAEFGHSAGGIAVVTMKSGTNDVHGSGYYYGRSSGLNAMSDRALRTKNDNPYWNAGGTIGLPLQKNKLFLFAVFERINSTQSSAGYYTLPTALERQGDFSQSYNADGSLRVIYDPLTSRFVNGVMVRDPFPGNKIPASRWDPLASRILGGLWMPNNAGDDRTGFNNFKYQQELTFHYYNFSTRLDWQISDRWKAYARVSRMKTDQDG
ncbi:MAG: carboxypeptidase regulatory-like domain-containing protein, partial [Betaproteobacteria bacterium]